MAKYYDWETTFRADASQITIISTYGPTQRSTIVARDGSEETNFKAAVWAHKLEFTSLAPSSTSSPCYLASPNKWNKNVPTGTITTDPATVKVPTGNSGVLVLNYDPEAFTHEYQINSGSWTTFTDGNTVTVVDGDTLKFRFSTLGAQDFVNGTVTDQDTGITLDAFAVLNTTP